jgi:hypothetical protein
VIDEGGTMYRTQRHILVALVIAAAVVVPVGTGVAAPTTRATVPARLVGTWGKTMTYATWHKNAVEFEPSGHWAIVIAKAGVTSIFEPPGKPESYPALTTMHVAATGASVVFGPTADHYCPGKASYTWKVSGRTLALKVRTTALHGGSC